MKDYLIMLEERYHLNCAFDCIPTQINKGNSKEGIKKINHYSPCNGGYSGQDVDIRLPVAIIPRVTGVIPRRTLLMLKHRTLFPV